MFRYGMMDSNNPKWKKQLNQWSFFVLFLIVVMILQTELEFGHYKQNSISADFIVLMRFLFKWSTNEYLVIILKSAHINLYKIAKEIIFLNIIFHLDMQTNFFMCVIISKRNIRSLKIPEPFLGTKPRKVVYSIFAANLSFVLHLANFENLMTNWQAKHEK